MFLQVKWLLWSSLGRFHHWRFWGLYRWSLRDVRAPERPERSLQNHRQSLGERLAAGLLYRCENFITWYDSLLKKCNWSWITQIFVVFSVDMYWLVLTYLVLDLDESILNDCVPDYQCLRHGSRYVQEAGQGSRLLCDCSQTGSALIINTSEFKCLCLELHDLYSL